MAGGSDGECRDFRLSEITYGVSPGGSGVAVAELCGSWISRATFSHVEERSTLEWAWSNASDEPTRGRESAAQAARSRPDARQRACCRRCSQKSPEAWASRERANFLVGRFGVAVRRACRLMMLNQSTRYYRSRKKDTAALRMRLRELAEGTAALRLSTADGAAAARGLGGESQADLSPVSGRGAVDERTKKRKKPRASHLRVVPPAPTAANRRWSMDFVTEPAGEGRALLSYAHRRRCLHPRVRGACTRIGISRERR